MKQIATWNSTFLGIQVVGFYDQAKKSSFGLALHLVMIGPAEVSKAFRS